MEDWSQSKHCDLAVITTLGRLRQRVAEVRRQSGQDEREKGGGGEMEKEKEGNGEDREIGEKEEGGVRKRWGQGKNRRE